MSTSKRRQFTPDEKAAIVREHLVEKVEVSALCEKHNLQHSVFYLWRSGRRHHHPAGPAHRPSASSWAGPACIPAASTIGSSAMGRSTTVLVRRKRDDLRSGTTETTSRCPSHSSCCCPALPSCFQLFDTQGPDGLGSAGEFVCRGHVADGTVQALVIVVVDERGHHVVGFLQGFRALRPDGRALEGAVPPLNLAVRLRVVGRRTHVGHAAEADEQVEVAGEELGAVVGDGARLRAGVFLQAALEDELNVGLLHLFLDLPVDDEPAEAVEDGTEVVEGAGEIEIGDVDVPVLMGLERLGEAVTLVGGRRRPAVQATSVAQDAVDGGGRGCHLVGVHQHVGEPPIAVERVRVVEVEDGLTLRGLEPVIAWDAAVVLIDPPVTRLPVVEAAGLEPSPGQDAADGQFGEPGQRVDGVDNRVARIGGNPAAPSGPPILFFQADVLLGQLGDDAILVGQAGFELGDLAALGFEGLLLRVMPGGTAVLQGAGGVLEELVAPQVEQAGLDVVLLAQGRNLDLFDEVLANDGGLLIGGKLASLGRAHGSPSPPEFGGGWSHVSTDPVHKGNPIRVFRGQITSYSELGKIGGTQRVAVLRCMDHLREDVTMHRRSCSSTQPGRFNRLPKAAAGRLGPAILSNGEIRNNSQIRRPNDQRLLPPFEG
jgi:transposase-like protein